MYNNTLKLYTREDAIEMQEQKGWTDEQIDELLVRDKTLRIWLDLSARDDAFDALIFDRVYRILSGEISIDEEQRLKEKVEAELATVKLSDKPYKVAEQAFLDRQARLKEEATNTEEKSISDCYCIVQIDGKYKGSSNWNCCGYGYPEISDIPEKYKDEKKYKISKIGDLSKEPNK